MNKKKKMTLKQVIKGKKALAKKLKKRVKQKLQKGFPEITPEKKQKIENIFVDIYVIIGISIAGYFSYVIYRSWNNGGIIW